MSPKSHNQRFDPLSPFAISLLIFFLFTSPLIASRQETTVKIGVRAHSGAEPALKKWSPTADYLSHRIKGYSFEMVPFVWFDGMRTVVKKGGEEVEQLSIVNKHSQRIALKCIL